MRSSRISNASRRGLDLELNALRLWKIARVLEECDALDHMVGCTPEQRRCYCLKLVRRRLEEATQTDRGQAGNLASAIGCPDVTRNRCVPQALNHKFLGQSECGRLALACLGNLLYRIQSLAWRVHSSWP